MAVQILDKPVESDDIKTMSPAYKQIIQTIEVVKKKNTSTRSANVISTEIEYVSVYQQTLDTDLSIFDYLYTLDNMEKEQILIGNELMKHGNILRKNNKGQIQSFKCTAVNCNVINVYFPKNNDNIPETVYSYPRAANHIARALSRAMYSRKDFSALELNIGWGGFGNEQSTSI